MTAPDGKPPLELDPAQLDSVWRLSREGRRKGWAQPWLGIVESFLAEEGLPKLTRGQTGRLTERFAVEREGEGTFPAVALVGASRNVSLGPYESPLQNSVLHSVESNNVSVFFLNNGTIVTRNHVPAKTREEPPRNIYQETIFTRNLPLQSAYFLNDNFSPNQLYSRTIFTPRIEHGEPHIHFTHFNEGGARTGDGSLSATEYKAEYRQELAAIRKALQQAPVTVRKLHDSPQRARG